MVSTPSFHTVAMVAKFSVVVYLGYRPVRMVSTPSFYTVTMFAKFIVVVYIG